MQQPFTIRVIEAIRGIPEGRVSSYGRIARMAGNARAARQVARILHSSSRKEGLPWHRVVSKDGRISLPPGRGHAEQRALLEAEGVEFDDRGTIDLDRFLWRPESAAQNS